MPPPRSMVWYHSIAATRSRSVGGAGLSAVAPCPLGGGSVGVTVVRARRHCFSRPVTASSTSIRTATLPTRTPRKPTVNLPASQQHRAEPHAADDQHEKRETVPDEIRRNAQRPQRPPQRRGSLR